jgi:hypothetical protein
MKIGAENRTKVIAAAALGIVALALVVNFLWTSTGSSAPAVSTPAATTSRPVRAKKPVSMARSLDPTLRYDWLKTSEDTKYAGNGRNIFQTGGIEMETPQGNGTTDHAEKESPPVPQGPPPPPPITLKFFGFANRAGEPKRVFLSQGDDIFVAAEGDIVDRRYKVLRIMPQAVEIEDVLNNNRQSIPLTQG